MKTAYAMRISDWSSDVCSSDLLDLPHHEPPVIERRNIDFHNIAIVVALGLDIGVVKGQPHQKAAARAQVDMLERPRRPLGWQPFRELRRARASGEYIAPRRRDQPFGLIQIGSAPCRERVCQNVSS